MTQLYHSRAYTPKTVLPTVTLEHPCSWLLYSQQPGNGTSLDVHQLINEL